jgi:hypothetical protein
MVRGVECHGQVVESALRSFGGLCNLRFCDEGLSAGRRGWSRVGGLFLGSARSAWNAAGNVSVFRVRVLSTLRLEKLWPRFPR